MITASNASRMSNTDALDRAASPLDTDAASGVPGLPRAANRSRGSATQAKKTINPIITHNRRSSVNCGTLKMMASIPIALAMIWTALCCMSVPQLGRWNLRISGDGRFPTLGVRASLNPSSAILIELRMEGQYVHLLPNPPPEWKKDLVGASGKAGYDGHGSITTITNEVQ